MAGQGLEQVGAGIGALVQIHGLDAAAPGHLDEVGHRLEAGGIDPLLVEQGLLLVHQAQGGVVHNDDLDVRILLGGGHQFLDVHQDGAVAGEADHGAPGFGQGGADGGGQAEAHGAQTAGRKPLARPAQGIGLGHPHLVLAHVGGDDGLVVQAGGHGADQAEVAAGIVAVLGQGKGMLAFQLVDAGQPCRPLPRLHQGQQGLQHLGRVAGDTHVGSLDLVQLGRVDVDVDDARPRAELGHLARGPVVEAGPHGDQQVALVQGQVGGAGPVHAQHAQGKPVIHGHGAQGHEGHHRGQLSLLRQLHGQGRGAPGHHPAAQVEDGLLGPVDQVGSSLQQRLGGRRRGLPGPGRGPVGDADAFGLDILGHIHQHRPGAAGSGDFKGPGQHFQELGGGADQEVVLGDGQGQAVGIHLLESVGADQGLGHLAGDGHQGDGIQLGISDGREQVGGAGPRGGDAHGRLSRDPGHALGHEAGALLVPGQHVVDAGGAGQGVVEGQDGAARDAGHGTDALAFQQAHDDLGAAQGFRVEVGLPGMGLGQFGKVGHGCSPFSYRLRREEGPKRETPARFAPAGVLDSGYLFLLACPCRCALYDYRYDYGYGNDGHGRRAQAGRHEGGGSTAEGGVKDHGHRGGSKKRGHYGPAPRPLPRGRRKIVAPPARQALMGRPGWWAGCSGSPGAPG